MVLAHCRQNIFIIYNFMATLKSQSRAPKPQSPPSREAPLTTTAILQSMERHREIMREHVARNRRRLSQQKKIEEKEAVLRRQLLEKMKEDRKLNYERFLKAQNQETSKSREAATHSRTAPLPSIQQKHTSEHADKICSRRFPSNGDRRSEHGDSEEEQWKNFEVVEKEVLTENNENESRNVQRTLKARTQNLSHVPKLPGVGSQSSSVASKLSSLADMSLPARLKEDISREDESELATFLSAPKESSSGLKRRFYSHIDRGRTIHLDRDEIQARERELLASLKALDEKANQLTAKKESPALSSPDNAKEIIQTLEGLDEFSFPLMGNARSASPSITEFRAEQVSHGPCLMADMPSISQITEFPVFNRKEKHAYYRPPSPLPQNILQNAEIGPVQEKVEGQAKFEFNQELLKGLFSN